jgi:hypothetical protein
MLSFPHEIFEFFKHNKEAFGGAASAVAVITAVAKIGPTIKRALKRHKDRISLRIGAGSVYTPADIARATARYIEPDCQSVDPSGGEEFRAVYAARENAFKSLDALFSESSQYRYTIVLADSGMGKSSLLLNYYARHQRRRRPEYTVALVPLGIPDAIERIKAVSDPADTVLFLDAFDEDTSAIKDHKKRISELLDISRNCRHVLITCRTQFFVRDEEIPNEAGILRIGVVGPGEARQYVFHKLYLSPFSNEQINAYIHKRFPFWRRSERQRAAAIVAKMKDLSARPMLLAHIDDLLKSGRSCQYSFQIYEEMIAAWLSREEPFVEKIVLRKFSERLAADIYLNRERRASEKIPYSELKPLAETFGIKTDLWQLSGRSLLNRDAAGNYKFSHRSIMEYLFIQAFTKNPSIALTPWTDQIVRFWWEMLQQGWVEKRQWPSNARVDRAWVALGLSPILNLRSSDKSLEASVFKTMSVGPLDYRVSEAAIYLSRPTKPWPDVFRIFDSDLRADLVTGLIWHRVEVSPLGYDHALKVIDTVNKHIPGVWRLPTLEEALSFILLPRTDVQFERSLSESTIWIADWIGPLKNGCRLVATDSEIHIVNAISSEDAYCWVVCHQFALSEEMPLRRPRVRSPSAARM